MSSRKVAVVSCYIVRPGECVPWIQCPRDELLWPRESVTCFDQQIKAEVTAVPAWEAVFTSHLLSLLHLLGPSRPQMVKRPRLAS